MKHRPRDRFDDLEHAPVETQEWGSPQSLVVGLDCRSMNLYRFLRVRFPHAPRGALQQWISEGLVAVNGVPVRDSRPLRDGDVVEITPDVRAVPTARRDRKQRAPEILYRDEAVLVVHKPPGMASAPERQTRQRSLLEVLKRTHDGGDSSLKLVHRIDKQASGVVVFARGREAKRALVQDFAERRVVKDYFALVSGHLTEDLAVCRARIGRAPGRVPRMTVVEQGGKEATTLVRRAFEFRGYTAVHARPITGRTHQIRVHLQWMGNSIVGDPLYAGEPGLYLSRIKLDYRRGRGEAERPLLDRVALHAARIRFRSPAEGREVTVEAPLPRDLLASLKQLQKHGALRPEEEYHAWIEQPLGPQDPEEDPFGGGNCPPVP